MTAGEHMRIKSYFAKSVDQALAEARMELGDDAVLLNTRKVPSTQTKSGGYELTFGVSGEQSEDSAQAIVAPPVTRAASEAAKASIASTHVTRQVMSAAKLAATPLKPTAQQLASSKLLNLHRELDEIRTNLPEGFYARASAPAAEPQKSSAKENPHRSGPLASEVTFLHDKLDEIRRLLERSSRSYFEIGRRVPELANIYSRLLDGDVDAAMAKDIVNRVESALTNPDSSAEMERRLLPHSHSSLLKACLGEELENRVALAPRLAETEKNVGEGSVVVLIGPRGAGKTTSLAKLAISSSRFGSMRAARFLSLDLSRSTAHVQLQSVAATYGIAFQRVYADQSLAGVIAAGRLEDAVFIDTTGYASREAKVLEETAEALAQCSALDVHLVVPAYMKACDLRKCIDTYAPFHPTKLLVTKFDEASTLGSIYSEAARAELKLSYVTNGPGIPHDIRAISSDDLLEMAIDRPKARVQRVA